MSLLNVKKGKKQVHKVRAYLEVIAFVNERLTGHFFSLYHPHAVVIAKFLVKVVCRLGCPKIYEITCLPKNEEREGRCS